MEVLESALLAECIGYIKLNWSARSREDQRRHRLRELVSKVRAVVAAVEELERLAGPCGDLDMFVRALSLDAAATEDGMDVDGDAATEDDMDVDGRPAAAAAPGARHRQAGSGRICSSAGSAAALLPPSPGAKRKRACGGGREAGTVQPQKRRRLAWMRSHPWLPSGAGRVSAAPREPRPPALRRSRHARSVALAMSRIRHRGRPTTTRHRPQPSLGQHFSRITL